MQLSLLDPVEIPLTKGQVALVDPCDSDLINLRWWACKGRATFYAQHSVRHGRKTGAISLHRLILARKLGRELQPYELVDHADGDGLNNRRSNLRLATNSQNMGNRRKPSNNTSGYKGVYFNRNRQRWYTQIEINGKYIFIGSFTDKETAHEAYCKVAIEYLGEFARLE